MDAIGDTILRSSGGVVGIRLEENGQRVGSGTGFLIPGYFVTASHVLRKASFDTVVIRQSGAGASDDIRMAAEAVLGSITRPTVSRRSREEER